MDRQAIESLHAATPSGARITPKLYACRDAARLLLGDQYGKRMSELGATLGNEAKAAECSILQAAANAARGIDGAEALQVLAAAVELVEPSA